jgi:predicted ArsR family transcriptional regulator
MKTTRQRLLEYVQVKGVATAPEIARALHLTAANIRHHLSILLEEGALEVAGERAASSRGRPTRLFALSRQMAAHHLDGLAAALLQELAGALPPAAQEQFLRKIAARLAAGKEPAARSFTQRLTQAVQRLKAMNYAARWEARPAAPRLILGHCPYAAILPEHPELCRMDAALLEELLGVPVVQSARLEPNQQGLPQCVFQVMLKAGNLDSSTVR